MTAVPLAVPAPLTSRHDPDPVIEPSLLCRHCWVARPSHAEMTAGVPGEVWLFWASTHRVPLVVRSSPAEVNSNAWALPPVQSAISNAVPAVPESPFTCRQRPDATPTR